MKELKIKDLREKTIAELQLEEKKQREELMKVRFAKAANQLKDTSKPRAIGRGIAKILTAIKEKGEKK